MKKQTPYTLDNKTTREVYNDLRRRGIITGMKYDTYLGRLQARHLAARKEEFEARKINWPHVKEVMRTIKGELCQSRS
jgi:hypothetical protein